MSEVIILSSDEDEDEEDKDIYEVEKILDVRLMNRVIQYKIAWSDSSETTWEPEKSFLGGESLKMLLEFKEANKERIDYLKQELDKKKRRKTKPKKEEEVVENNDSFDLPSTEELLATIDTKERVSRSKTAELKKIASDQGSGGESRSHTPCILRTPPKRRGRPRIEKAAPESKNDKVTKIPIEEDEKHNEYQEENQPSTSVGTDKDIDENDNEIGSETPPEPEEQKFFLDRDDEDESEELWEPKVKINSANPVENIQKLIKNMVCKQESLIDAILREDLVSARILYKKMRVDEVEEIIFRYKDQNGRPLLHTLIHSTNAISLDRSSALAAMRFVISISRQFIFCISDGDENIAMHEAVRTKNSYAIRLFANCGSLLMKKNKLGQTPFDIAIINKDIGAIKFLLNQGVTFHELLPNIPITPIKYIVHSTPDIMHLIQETHAALQNELQRMRKRLYKGKLQDIRAVTDVLIAPRHDSNDIEFNFDYVDGKLDNNSQGHLLMVFPIAYSTSRMKWICSSSTTRLCGPPILNDMHLKHAQYRTNPTVFYAVPKSGPNHLKLQLSNNNWNSEMAITAQLVRYEIVKSAPPPAPSSVPLRPVSNAPPPAPSSVPPRPVSNAPPPAPSSVPPRPILNAPPPTPSSVPPRPILNAPPPSPSSVPPRPILNAPPPVPTSAPPRQISNAPPPPIPKVKRVRHRNKKNQHKKL